jgi:hypothetical protein
MSITLARLRAQIVLRASDSNAYNRVIFTDRFCKENS